MRYSLISDGDVITHQIANAKIIIPEEPMVPAGETQTNLGSVQTGDHTAWILYSSLSVISLVMIAALLKRNRKKV